VEAAVLGADVVVSTLIFADYDDVVAMTRVLDPVPKIQKRLIFELATELMVEYNQVGSFNMKSKEGEQSGAPPAVKALLSKFGSRKKRTSWRLT